MTHSSPSATVGSKVIGWYPSAWNKSFSGLIINHRFYKFPRCWKMPGLHAEVQYGLQHCGLGAVEGLESRRRNFIKVKSFSIVQNFDNICDFCSLDEQSTSKGAGMCLFGGLTPQTHCVSPPPPTTEKCGFLGSLSYLSNLRRWSFSICIIMHHISRKSG